jgi:nickel transport protein
MKANPTQSSRTRFQTCCRGQSNIGLTAKTLSSRRKNALLFHLRVLCVFAVSLVLFFPRKRTKNILQLLAVSFLVSKRSARLNFGLVLILAFALVGNVQAHRMNHTVSHDQAVVVSLSYSYGHPPAYETYRVYAPGEELVFKNGRTDAQGRLSFSPDRAGAWRVVVSTDDGHGVDLEIEVSEDMVVTVASGPGHSHFGMILAGVGYLFGLAGALVLWRQRSRRVKPD